MFRLNLKIALRNLWKNKAYTLINMGGLAIGLASCMVLLMYVAYEWSFDKQFKNNHKTYVVYNLANASGRIFSWAWTPGDMAPDVEQSIPGVAYASHSSYPEDRLISYGQRNFKKSGVFADPSFLKILDYKFVKGNPDKVLKGVNTIILTETMARNLFGDEDPINKTVKLDNAEVLKVEAIIEDIPKNNSIRFDYLMPWALNVKVNPWMKTNGYEGNFCLTLIQLQDNNYFERANAQIKGIYKQHKKDSNSEAIMHPLSKWHLYSNFENGKSVGGRIDQIKIFFILAFCILLIACVNFMNLSTARSEKRGKEVGVRKTIGSSRKSLIGQFLLESLLLALMGMLVAFVLLEISLPYFDELLDVNLSINYSDWRFWSALTGLTLITGFIAGSYPAFYLSSFEPVKVLKGATIVGNSSLSVRRVLVVFQFVFATCLIICTTVIYQQLSYIKNKPIGYQRAGLIEMPIQGNFKAPEKLNTLKDLLIKSGAVSSVTSFSRGLNEDGNNTFSVEWPGKNLKDETLFNFRFAGLDFVKTIGTDMISGREFLSSSDSSNAIINESAAKIMGLKNPVGTMINSQGTPLNIIGVMRDFVIESPYYRARPMIVYHHMREVNVIIARLNPAMNVSNAIGKIDEIIKTLNPEYPVGRKFVNDGFEQKFQNEKLLRTLSNWFGGFAVFISCLGLLGLALFMAEQRKKEISIRKVLGASTTNILTLLNRDFIRLVVIANLIAFPLAYIIVNKWLSAYEYRINISILPFVIAAVLSLLIAILTVSVQSVKVAKSNPIDALKYE
ncbi:ABC transporter permease [Pedobacter frigoris]|uniref:FtsX-like permease family protein n=1 Tax=Pedobacter frigoris TaxID=2571272 RepID=A0A4U1CNP7_9SPHI|nr:ABC transporter permease [Pedobacter frigoris]TKC08876.1 FtsX-like permease family protein [Pedobacter frigoris]